MMEGNPLLAVALAVALALSGCVGNFDDDALSSSSSDGEASVDVIVAADEPGDAEHLGLQVDSLYGHDADANRTEGFHEIALSADHADLIAEGSTSEVELASGTIPADSYDQLLIRLSDATVEMAASDEGSNDGHDHSGGDGHDHSRSEGDSKKSAEKTSTGSLDMPVDVTFEATEDEPTTIRLVLDTENATSEDGFVPVFAEVEVRQGGETVTAKEDVTVDTKAAAKSPQTKKPAARITVFAPNGNQIHSSDFDAKDGKFVNSKPDAFKPGETVRFSGTESEAVEQGAEITDYAWDLDDGSTDTGATAEHSFDKLGVFEVELTVTDSNGVSATHMVRVIVLQQEWTTELVEASFEDGADGWETNASGSSATPAGEVQTTWELDGTGHDSSTAWHVGHHEGTHDLGQLLEPVDDEPGCLPQNATCVDTKDTLMNLAPGYTSDSTASLISPAFEIPENWASAGYEFYVGGATEPGSDPLTITYTVDGEAGGQIAKVDAPGQWVQFEGEDALTDAVGSEVQFVFTFTSDGNTEQGPGFYVDDFKIGGVDLPLQKAELLDQNSDGHGGHDHSH